MRGDRAGHERPVRQADQRERHRDEQRGQALRHAHKEQPPKVQTAPEQRELDRGERGDRKLRARHRDHKPIAGAARERRDRVSQQRDGQPQQQREAEVAPERDVRRVVQPVVGAQKLVLNQIFLEARVGEQVGKARDHQRGGQYAVGLGRDEPGQHHVDAHGDELGRRFGGDGPLCGARNAPADVTLHGRPPEWGRAGAPRRAAGRPPRCSPRRSRRRRTGSVPRP